MVPLLSVVNRFVSPGHASQLAAARSIVLPSETRNTAGGNGSPFCWSYPLLPMVNFFRFQGQARALANLFFGQMVRGLPIWVATQPGPMVWVGADSPCPVETR